MKKLIISFLLISMNCSAQYGESGPFKIPETFHLTLSSRDSGRNVYDTVKVRLLIDIGGNVSMAAFQNGYVVRKFYTWEKERTHPYGGLWSPSEYLQDDKFTSVDERTVWSYHIQDWIKQPPVKWTKIYGNFW